VILYKLLVICRAGSYSWDALTSQLIEFDSREAANRAYGLLADSRSGDFGKVTYKLY
jgi:hypothetical protein